MLITIIFTIVASSMVVYSSMVFYHRIATQHLATQRLSVDPMPANYLNATDAQITIPRPRDDPDHATLSIALPIALYPNMIRIIQ